MQLSFVIPIAEASALFSEALNDMLSSSCTVEEILAMIFTSLSAGTASKRARRLANLREIVKACWVVAIRSSGHYASVGV